MRRRTRVVAAFLVPFILSGCVTTGELGPSLHEPWTPPDMKDVRVRTLTKDWNGKFVEYSDPEFARVFGAGDAPIDIQIEATVTPRVEIALMVVSVFTFLIIPSTASYTATYTAVAIDRATGAEIARASVFRAWSLWLWFGFLFAPPLWAVNPSHFDYTRMACLRACAEELAANPAIESYRKKSLRDLQPPTNVVALGILAKDDDDGARVVGVKPGTRASEAGLVAGDRVTSVRGEPVANANELADRVSGAGGLDLGIDRDGVHIVAIIAPEERTTRSTDREVLELARLREQYEQDHYPNGRVRATGPVAQGSRQGSWTFFREDGTVAMKVDYRNGEPDGTATVFGADGQTVVRTIRYSSGHVASED